MPELTCPECGSIGLRQVAEGGKWDCLDCGASILQLTPVVTVRLSLEAMAFVEWDRAAKTDDGRAYFYGWIAREDGRRDFVVVEYALDTGLPGWWLTSSAKYSLTLHKLLDPPDVGHEDCLTITQVMELFHD